HGWTHDAGGTRRAVVRAVVRGGPRSRCDVGRDQIQTLTSAAATHAVARTLRSAAYVTLDFLLPPACATCERSLDDGERGLVCGRCWSRLELLPFPQCPRCGHTCLRPTCTRCDLLPA